MGWFLLTAALLLSAGYLWHRRVTDPGDNPWVRDIEAAGAEVIDHGWSDRGGYTINARHRGRLLRCRFLMSGSVLLDLEWSPRALPGGELRGPARQSPVTMDRMLEEESPVALGNDALILQGDERRLIDALLSEDDRELLERRRTVLRSLGAVTVLARLDDGRLQAQATTSQHTRFVETVLHLGEDLAQRNPADPGQLLEVLEDDPVPLSQQLALALLRLDFPNHPDCKEALEIARETTADPGVKALAEADTLAVLAWLVRAPAALPHTRAIALRKLARDGERAHLIAPVASALASGDGVLQRAAVEVVRERLGGGANALLRSGAEGELVELAEAAAHALQLVCEQDAADLHLTQMLTLRASAMRLAALDALEDSGGIAALPGLRHFADSTRDRTERRRARAVEAAIHQRQELALAGALSVQPKRKDAGALGVSEGASARGGLALGEDADAD